MAVYYATESEDTALEHHGIKGMKWGVRRFQNPDGTLTAKGRERYGGDRARKYKEGESSIASKKLSKALRKGDKVKANKYMRQIQALNKMSEDDIIKEQLRLEKAGTIAGALGGFVGSAIAAPIITIKTRQGRVETFMKDYKDMTLNELENIFRNS